MNSGDGSDKNQGITNGLDRRTNKYCQSASITIKQAHIYVVISA